MAADPEVPADHPRPRVALATIARDGIGLNTHVSIIQALSTGRLVHHLLVASGPYLDAGRNKAVAGAMNLRTPEDMEQLAWDWLLFVDSDIEFGLDTFDALFHVTTHPDYDPTRYPVMGGVYVNPFDDAGVEGDEESTYGGNIGPVVYEWTERDDLPGELNGIPTPTFVRLSRAALATRAPVNMPWNPPSPNGLPSPITEVAAIGTGFLAIHSSILNTLADHYGQPLPWFDEPVVHGVHYGEDFGFCHRVRELGYPVLAHRGCTPLHHKTIKLI